LAAAGLVVVTLRGLLFLVRSKPAKEKEPSAVEARTDAAGAKPAQVGAPHWRRPAAAGNGPLHKEISKLVEEDPEAAANILRKWIGQTG
jgi:flagellar biosynthesis/type III secretory pathway M-ring protein FliF/YscJ